MENGVIFRGESHPTVTCTLSTDAGSITIRVEDNAVGICAEVKEKIFEMFYRGSEKSIGNGLGLFMVMKALEILEGSISFESIPGQGTIFTVRIPKLTDHGK
jgi:signal transduction histidine kinase